MKRLVTSLGLTACLVGLVSAEEAFAADPSSKIDTPPRKVVVGTAIFGTYGKYPGLEERIQALCGLVDEMARQASAKSPGHGLDLAVLPETSVTSNAGGASSRAILLDGPVRETFRKLAQSHKTYIVVPMDLTEIGPKGPTYSNAAVLFDRKGDIAGVYRKAHPVALLGRSDLEGGISPGREFPVFACDFGKLGIQICWDIKYDDGWDALGKNGAIVGIEELGLLLERQERDENARF
ncbi:carbon-nitrogen hydrolase family protein, partial [Singulisphaera rosea]